MHYSTNAFLFDLDGVIVNTDRYHYLGWKKLADEQGWAFDEEVNDACRGVPRMASLEVILRHNGVTLPEDQKHALASRKNAYYVELLQGIGEADVIPGAVAFLQQARALDLKTALCSSSKNAPLVLSNLGLEPYFDTVVTGHDIERAKPDPQIFLLAAERLGERSEACIVFEDAPSGVQGALAAGMRCFGIGSPEFLPQATWTARDFLQLDAQALSHRATV